MASWSLASRRPGCPPPARSVVARSMAAVRDSATKAPGAPAAGLQETLHAPSRRCTTQVISAGPRPVSLARRPMVLSVLVEDRQVRREAARGVLARLGGGRSAQQAQQAFRGDR